MGLLDQFKGPLLDEVMGLIKNQGGLSGLAGKLKNAGRCRRETIHLSA